MIFLFLTKNQWVKIINLKIFSLKKIILFHGLLVVLALFSFSCSQDDDQVVNSSPAFLNLVDEISSLPGQTFRLRGIIEDEAGISSIKLVNEEWFLNKTIRKDSLPKSYQLDYQFIVPDDAIENSSHTILITAVNAGGVSTQEEVLVTLDADIQSPQILINSPADGATVLIGEGDEIQFDITVTDNRDIRELRIESDVFNETVQYTGSTVNYQSSFNIDEPGVYSFTVIAVDAAGNESSLTTEVNVVEDLNFLRMYLADTDSQAAFSSALSGYPYSTISSTEAGEEGYVFNIRYYAELPNTGVRFVAQNSGFGPFAFGANTEKEGELAIGSDNTVDPIVIPEIGYYDIEIDLRDLSYSVSPIADPGSPNIAGFTGLYATGTGMIINGQSIDAYNPAASAPLEVDPNNAFRYTATVQFNAENGSFIFVGNQENWGVFWRMNTNDIENTTSIIPQGGVESGFNQQYNGDYELTIDLYLNTFRITQL